MIINNNIPALNTFRQMGINKNAAQNSMEKLSSGLRINRAGDDAAGLAISEKMRAQIRGLDQASRNSQDSISMIQTAEGALQETQNILQRMRELATQSANDTNVEVDRNEIQKEINQLTSEINRIGNTTEFNTQRLLNGDKANTKVNTGAKIEGATNGQLSVGGGLSVELNGAATGNISVSNITVTENPVSSTPTIQEAVASEISVTLATGSTPPKFTGGTIGIDATGVNRDFLVSGGTAAATASVSGTGTLAAVNATSATTSITLGSGAIGMSGSFDIEVDGSGVQTINVTSGMSGGDIAAAINTHFAGTANFSSGVLTITSTTSGTTSSVAISNVVDSGGTPAGLTSGTVTGAAAIASGTLGAGAAGQLSLSIDGGAKVDVALSGGMTMDDVAAAINAAFSGASGYGATFNNVASVDASGKLVLTGNTAAASGAVTIHATASGTTQATIDRLGLSSGTTNGVDSVAGDGATFTLTLLSGNKLQITNDLTGASTDDIIEMVDGKFSYNNHGVSFEITDLGDMKAGDTVEFTVNGADPKDIGAEPKLWQGSVTDIAGSGSGATLPEFTNGGISVKGDAQVGTWTVTASGSGSSQMLRLELESADGTIVTDTISKNASGNFAYDAHGISFTLNPGTLQNGSELKMEVTAPEKTYTVKADINGTTETLSSNYKGGALSGVDLAGLTFSSTGTISNSTDTTDVNVKDTFAGDDKSMKFQIGANQNQALNLAINDMRSEALGISKAGGTTGANDGMWVEISRGHDSLLDAGKMITGSDAEAEGLSADKFYIKAYFTATESVTDGTTATNQEYALDMSTHDRAAAAITVINDAIERVSAERSMLGANQNRLEHTISNLNNAAENLQAAESRVRDVDMAREVMEMTKNNILAQASQAMLAQANQAPQSVLQLLG